MAKTKRVNILLEEDTHTKAKIISVLKNLTLNEYLDRAVKESIERDQSILNKIKELKR